MDWYNSNMIDLNDFIIKEYIRKDKRGGINNQKLYKFTCNKCSKDRGYLKKNSSATCGSCACKNEDQEGQILRDRIRNNLRGRLYQAIKRNYKAGSAISDLGCSIEEFKIYIEKQFKEGMTWDNWSRTGWHIDHITPLDSFDLDKKEEFTVACHYSNLRPLWAKDNLSKGCKSLNDTIVEIIE